ncbi:MAG: hypothetical protein H3C45_02805 [Bacteroidia bacterium]|nr:hypothetical protein [Bacteroidia bacterium]MCC7532903.1 hypothetical protein [Bacteroidia bacterium]MCZ2141443.1 hypothetical protein [Bacteroidia bacterium]
MEVHLLQTEINTKPTTLISLLDASLMSKTKNNKAIVGVLKKQETNISPDNIIYNPEFIDFFHKTIVAFSAFVTGVNPISTNGFMYVIDERSKTPESPLQEDIIGSFEVIAGVINNESYVPNVHYRLISANGVFQLPKQMEKVLLAALLA